MAKGKRHNLSKHPLFKVWLGIVSRCYCEGSKDFHRYGARGVRVCDLWRYNFKEFYDWALTNRWVKGLQIDKDILPKKLGIPPILYSPETCCIVTGKENSNNRISNRIIEYMGNVKTLKQWSEYFGISNKLLMFRLKKMSFEEAIKNPALPVTRKIICTSNNEKYNSVKEAAEKLKVNPCAISMVLTGRRKSTGGLKFEYLK